MNPTTHARHSSPRTLTTPGPFRLISSFYSQWLSINKPTSLDEMDDLTAFTMKFDILLAILSTLVYFTAPNPIASSIILAILGSVFLLAVLIPVTTMTIRRLRTAGWNPWIILPLNLLATVAYVWKMTILANMNGHPDDPQSIILYALGCLTLLLPLDAVGIMVFGVLSFNFIQLTMPIVIGITLFMILTKAALIIMITTPRERILTTLKNAFNPIHLDKSTELKDE